MFFQIKFTILQNSEYKNGACTGKQGKLVKAFFNADLEYFWQGQAILYYIFLIKNRGLIVRIIPNYSVYADKMASSCRIILLMRLYLPVNLLEGFEAIDAIFRII